MHDFVDGSSGGVYLLAAAITEPDRENEVRERLRNLLMGKSRRLHWRDEGALRRRDIAAAIASCQVRHLVVVGRPLDARKQERARRLCLEALLIELHRWGVTRVVVEGRKAAQDTRDRRMVDAVRSKGLISREVRLEFLRASDEPLLWIPDAVAGAIGSALKADDPVPHRLLSDSIDEQHVFLT